MSLRTRHLVMVLLAVLGLSSRALASSTGSVTVTGVEQSTSGMWDMGTVTVSINGYAKTVTYGEFSTSDSIASAIAAMFSGDCNSPANAKSSSGGVISVQMKGSATLAQLNVSFSSNLSFNGSANLSTAATMTVATIGSAQVLLGQSTPIDVQVNCNSACGLVDYRLDGGEWGTVALDGNGHFTAGTGGNWSPGLHNVVVKFLGNGTYMPSTSNPVSFTISNSSTPSIPTGIYSYNISSYAANGNVSAYSDSVNGSWSSIGYDGVNRLSSATYNAIGAPTQYLCWAYDSFGNRTGQNITSGSCSIPSPAQYPNNQVPGIGYDASGNVTNDGTNQYLYDADGRVCAVQYPVYSGITGMMQYIYDGDGNRVAKGTISTWSCDPTSNGFVETAGYVLGPNGEQATEVDGGGNWVHTNVYASGALVATYDPAGLHFYLADWLGTRRVQTDISGSTQEGVYQNLPFGEMVPDNHTYSLGATEHHFTGQERDTESGIDYFHARYFGSGAGRWMSPDPYDGSMDLGYPQTLNRYAYVGNNPLGYTDPSGLDPIPCAPVNGVPTLCDNVGSTSNGSQPSTDWDDWLDPFEWGSDIASLFYHPKFDSTTKPRPNKKTCSAPKYAQARNFITSNLTAAQTIATQLNTAPGNILGLSGNESGWGTGFLISAGTNNYFSLTAGRAFGGTIGTYQHGSYTYGTYSSFLASGQSFANSYFGTRVNGITDPLAFAQALNANGSFNSENLASPYAQSIANTINLVNTLIPCP